MYTRTLNREQYDVQPRYKNPNNPRFSCWLKTFEARLESHATGQNTATYGRWALDRMLDGKLKVRGMLNTYKTTGRWKLNRTMVIRQQTNRTLIKWYIVDAGQSSTGWRVRYIWIDIYQFWKWVQDRQADTWIPMYDTGRTPNSTGNGSEQAHFKLPYLCDLPRAGISGPISPAPLAIYDNSDGLHTTRT